MHVQAFKPQSTGGIPRATTIERDTSARGAAGRGFVALVAEYSNKKRLARGKLFSELFSITQNDNKSVLDLGGGSGDHIAAIMPRRHGITVADHSAEKLALARERHGFDTILLGADGRVPAEDHSFDVVFCSSVIEHVTGPKADALRERDGRTFAARAHRYQQAFAAEVGRVGKGYFVQTPYKYFLVESHSLLPGAVVLLPRPWFLTLSRVFDRFWPKKSYPDWQLLDKQEMRSLFPDADLVCERSIGMTKSLIAVRKL